MKIIFAGTTAFGIPTLERVKNQYEIIAVITRPNQPVGRKKIITPPPIKSWALQNNVPVLQPEKISNFGFRISNFDPDLLLVAAYGQIIPKEILDIPKFGSINIHASLLPKYRGASPIQAAILNGEKTTGITLIKMDEKMDHGSVVASATTTIDNDNNYNSLQNKLSLLAAELVAKTIPDWFAGKIIPQEQNHDQATFTKLLSLTDGRIDWTLPALEIERKIKALNPKPGTWTTLDGKSVKILEALAVDDRSIDLPGKIYDTEGKLMVKCNPQSLVITKLQPEGKTLISGKDFLNGLRKARNKIFV